jgi:hypothetical protein
MSALPTLVQDIAVRLMFKVMGEEQVNRTHEEYADIARRLPPLKKLHYLINASLKAEHAEHASGRSSLPQICRFKAGHQIIRFETYPLNISYETIRAALVAYGFREPRRRNQAKQLMSRSFKRPVAG